MRGQLGEVERHQELAQRDERPAPEEGRAAGADAEIEQGEGAGRDRDIRERDREVGEKDYKGCTAVVPVGG